VLLQRSVPFWDIFQRGFFVLMLLKVAHGLGMMIGMQVCALDAVLDLSCQCVLVDVYCVQEEVD
jgi:hypothetical protein